MTWFLFISCSTYMEEPMGCSPIGSDTKCLQHLHQKGFAISSSLSILETAMSLFIQGCLYIIHKKIIHLILIPRVYRWLSSTKSVRAQSIVLISFFTSLLTLHLFDSMHLIVGFFFFFWTSSQTSA